MRFPLAYLGFTAAQVPQLPMSLSYSQTASAMSPFKADFAFKDGPGVFSPKDLVELGRTGAAVANPNGNLALVSYSKYSFQDKKNNKSVFVVSLDSPAKSVQIPLENGGETFWLSSQTFVQVVESQDGSDLYAHDLNLDLVFSGLPLGNEQGHTSRSKIGSIPSTTASNFKFNPTTGVLVFSAYVYPDGDLKTVNDQDREWEERGNSALVYDKTYVRHWDVWQGQKGPHLFSVKIQTGSDGSWKLGENFTSPLKGTRHYTPVEPFGGMDDFDVSETHIVYTSKDPELPEAWHTKQNVYIVPISGSMEPIELTSGKQGATHGPVFNTKGTKVAWLELDEDGYESDRSKIVIYDLTKRVRFTITQAWDRSPIELVFSKDDDFLYLTAGDEAKIKVFVLPIPPTPLESTTHPKLDPIYTTPVPLTQSKAASGLQILPGRILFSQSSFTSPNDAYVINDLRAIEQTLLADDTSLKIEPKIYKVTDFWKTELKGKNLSEGEEFWFKGAEGKSVQGWTLKPKGWKDGDTKKWPVVLLIHGGPQSAWEDQWSTRWNPNVFAQQGYFVVLINPTGSTTFGQDFTDAISEDWGGKPFVDMINGWKYILNRYPEIDPDRAVAAGASWGGYAINWIQGHPEYGFNFKALVCHDGVFDSTYNGYSTDELFFFNHEWGGRPWDPESKKLSQKMNPANFVHRWSTPALLIHGSKDYRLPETDGIGAFHALQQLGVPSRLMIFPDENHWVLNHGNSLKWHYEVFRWFDQFVGEHSKAVVRTGLLTLTMNQDSFRRLLEVSRSSTISSTLGAASSSRSRLAVQSRHKNTTEVVSKPAFKPRNISKADDSIKGREPKIPQDKNANTPNDNAAVEPPPSKGLDFALLEQEKAKAGLLSTNDVDELEQAFAESSAVQNSDEIAPKKRTREDFIRELKQKRVAEAGQQPSESVKVDDRPENANQMNKFKPIGSTSKRKKDDVTKADGKKKKRKVDNVQKESEPEANPPAASMTDKSPTKIPPDEDFDDNFDIFAGAGEYTGVEVDEDEEGSAVPSRVPEDSASLPQHWIAFDEPVPQRNPQPPVPLPEDRKPEANPDQEVEESMRLAPLESSTVPSIKKLLEMHDAADKYEKRMKRKEKRERKRGGGKGKGSDDE